MKAQKGMVNAKPAIHIQANPDCLRLRNALNFAMGCQSVIMQSTSMVATNSKVMPTINRNSWSGPENRTPNKEQLSKTDPSSNVMKSCLRVPDEIAIL